MDQFKTIKENMQTEIVEKKSRFIVNVFHIETEAQAEQILKEIRKKYHDAKHNCYAYRIIQEGQIVERSSDDEEPSKTAGIPILNVIQKVDLYQILIIVTRYFGGILLGTGGLTRAYSNAATEVIQKSKIIQLESGYELNIIIEYSEFELFKYYLKKRNIVMSHVEYENNISCIVEISKKEKELLYENLSNNPFKLLKIEIMKEKHIQKNVDI